MTDDESLSILYDLIKDLPEYRETSSHVVPSMIFAVDPIFARTEKEFVPLTLPQVGTKYGNA